MSIEDDVNAAREQLRMCRSNSAAWRELVSGFLIAHHWISATDALTDDVLRLALEQWVSAQPDFIKIMDECRAKITTTQEKLDRVRELRKRLAGVAPLWALELSKVFGDAPPCAFCGGQLVRKDSVERCNDCGTSAPTDGGGG